MAHPIKLSFPATRGYWEIPVLYEDESLLALDKPAGLHTGPPASEPDQPSLMQLLHAGIRSGKPWATDRGLGYASSTNHPDTEASGVVLIARSKPILKNLLDQFGEGKPQRAFSVLAHGETPAKQISITLPLARLPKPPERMRVDPMRGKKSVTQVTVLEAFRGFSYLQCIALTDRPHQVRVHLQRRRLPVVGDRLYGGRFLLLSELKPGYRFKPGASEKPLIARAAVHLSELRFTHPVSGSEIVIASPLPKDFHVALKYLRRFASATSPSSAEFNDQEDDLRM